MRRDQRILSIGCAAGTKGFPIIDGLVTDLCISQNFGCLSGVPLLRIVVFWDSPTPPNGNYQLACGSLHPSCLLCKSLMTQLRLDHFPHYKMSTHTLCMRSFRLTERAMGNQIGNGP